MNNHSHQFTSILNNYPKASRTILGMVITGIIALTIHKLSMGHKTTGIDEANLMPELPQPTLTQSQTLPQPKPKSYQTQIVILMPNSDQQIDCIKFGGGLGCFDDNYQPDVPTHWVSEKRDEPKRGEPRNVGIYKFW